MGDSSDEYDDNYIFDIGATVVNSMERVITVLEEEEDGVVNSQPRTRRLIPRDRSTAHERLMNHYFNDNAVYPANVFRRRFRMHKPLFLRIVNDVTNMSEFMQQRADARGTLGFSSVQKCAVAIRQLAYGSVSDSWDEYFQMSERVALESLDEFCSCVMQLYGRRYLRKPTPSDVRSLYAHHSQVHGFPGMLGSLDCLHWEWDGCRVSNHGQYTQGRNKHPTIILEAVASQDLWFWHTYFGPAGSNNDLNVLQVSPVFDHVLNGSAPDTSFQVNGIPFQYGYYLVDGIYHDWAVFVKTVTYPGDPIRDKYKRAQERARKDIERAFGALKKCWRILQSGARSSDRNKVARIMYTCCILNNMILEDEGRAICTYVEHENVTPHPPPIPPGSPQSLAIRQALRNHDTHHHLRHSLAQHLWTVNHIDLNTVPVDDAETFSD